jgi:hypothetical protein
VKNVHQVYEDKKGKGENGHEPVIFGFIDYPKLPDLFGDLAARFSKRL